ncbi:MAG: copper resistance protein B, partial [Alphaproteobacteria bacterium]
MRAFACLCLVVAAALFAVPASAQKGTWNAAADYYDPQDMAKAKRQLQRDSGGGALLFLQMERLEYQSNEGSPLLLWDAQGWYGGDIDKFWVKTEGEYNFDDDAFEEAEVQALYAHAIAPYFDLQAGVRHDFEPD